MSEPDATPTAALADIVYSDDGLVPAIVQDATDGTVLMMAWMTAETLEQSLREGRTVFWSRSRQQVWRKGDTSGDRQWITEVRYDCDGDTLLFLVDQEGNGACHTGQRSCFFRPLPLETNPKPESEGQRLSGEERTFDDDHQS